ncbi:anthranilate synthase component 1 [Salsuginibacillus halophilus]|uniref:Anthranilate synthase component 1 n=1 Tax=Salsuginibacillus halophilus TaxID=517424 RepID=A0A2P8HWE2_9BACI|nr:anthranilate synthase component I [Salsuginibacillus halophilus]PSL50498.1 anthranilate synthase component 1 [Salsuginibacillus halophilus]
MTTYETFQAQAEQYKTVPFASKMFADELTPIGMFQSVEREAVYLLESKDDTSPWAQFSFIGLNPRYTLTEADEGGYALFDENNKCCAIGADLAAVFEEAMKWIDPAPASVSLPFKGGAVGTIPYDAVEDFEPRLQNGANAEPKTPVTFLFCETLIAYDHAKKEVTVIHYAETPADAETAEAEVNRVLAKLSEPPAAVMQRTPPLDLAADIDFSKVTSNYEREQFEADVEKIKEYIHQGDTFQTVLSQRFERSLNVSAFSVYRALRMVNPSPYLFYLTINGVEIVGSSPERLVEVQDQQVEIHPIAGTRKRGATKEEDLALEEELMNDEKERAEHYMLVDLARNDVGRVAAYGSVNTPTLLEIGRFSHVMHIVSKVTGELAEHMHPLQALTASFPAGTVSGAPKVRAMEILQELEPTRRGIYAGGIGYFGYDGNIDSCIAIRTVLIKNGTAYVQAGAGVVADSDPAMEYEETVNKAKALFKAIETAEQAFEPKHEVE